MVHQQENTKNEGMITIIISLICFFLGFKLAEHIYKGETSLLDEDEDELFENKQ